MLKWMSLVFLGLLCKIKKGFDLNTVQEKAHDTFVFMGFVRSKKSKCV